MPNISDATDRFIPANRLPVLPLWSSGARAYSTLSVANSGAMIIHDSEVPLYCATAWFLKAAILLAAERVGPRSAPILSLGSHLVAFFNEKTGLHDRVNAAFREKFGDRGIELSQAAVLLISEQSLAYDGPEPERSFYDLFPVHD